MLAAEGLVTMKVRRGAYVTEVSERDLSRCTTCSRCSKAMPPRWWPNARPRRRSRNCRTLHEELEAAVKNRDKFFAINERFHMRLLELADNRWRDQMVADLRKVMKLNRHNSLLKSGRIQESLAEHAALMDALVRRDKEAARERMQEHFRNGLEAAA